MSESQSLTSGSRAPEPRRIRVEPTSSCLGAEISGVDLRETLSDDVVEEIHRAWLAHLMIYFRDQQLSPQQQLDFGARLGEIDTYPFIAPLDGYPGLIPIIKEPDNRFNFGGGWHSDTPYQEYPPKATMLYAREVPSRGGDTLFADCATAYESLSEGMRSLIADLRGVYSASKVHGKSGLYQKADHPMAMTKDLDRVEERYEHPIVRTHPETGRRALYVSLPHIEHFVGLTREESRPLLDFLAKHATRIEFSYRLQWRVGTLALWDNRAVQHYALNDYPGERREVHRLTLKGDRPV